MLITLDNGMQIGDGNFMLIAGPCSVESESQIVEIAKAVKKAGAVVLRGGAFKPRTHPYSFQGLGLEGLELLSCAKKITGLPVISEITDAKYLSYYDDIDILQVGARNMQNFELLKSLGRQSRPVLLKRSFGATYRELLSSAEYIIAEGNEKVILCERGIRSFETSLRYTFDVSAIPYIHTHSKLPVIADPSHAAGDFRFVEKLALAACAAGADGVMVEVHQDPQNAKSDGSQSLTPQNFERLCQKIAKLRAALEFSDD